MGGTIKRAGKKIEKGIGRATGVGKIVDELGAPAKDAAAAQQQADAALQDQKGVLQKVQAEQLRKRKLLGEARISSLRARFGGGILAGSSSSPLSEGSAAGSGL